MGPLELTFGVIVIFITLVALARGYAKELGSTVIILATIFVLSFFETRIVNLLNTVGPSLLGDDPATVNLFSSVLFEVIFIMAVFASYAGITFDFPGRQVGAPVGPLLTLAVGLLNG